MPHFCITPSGQIINLEKVVAAKPCRDDSDKFFVRVFVDSQLQVIILEGEDAEYFCGLAYFRENSSASHFNSQIVISDSDKCLMPEAHVSASF